MKTPSFRPIMKFPRPSPNPPMKTKMPKASNATAARVVKDAGGRGSINPKQH
jgi:hypothetical protein